MADKLSGSIEDLDAPPQVKSALKTIQAEISDAYRENFFAMTEAINKQASVLARIHNTLNQLVGAIAPQLKPGLPVAIGVAPAGENPDVATMLVAADPIGAGYTLSQADLAAVLGLPQADVKVLIRAFGLDQDSKCAVVVRKAGKSTRPWLNYNQYAVQRFRELVANPPKSLAPNGTSALRRVRARLIVDGGQRSS